MAKKKRKINPNAILTFGVLVGAGIVLYKFYKLSDQYEELAKNIKTKGLISSL